MIYIQGLPKASAQGKNDAEVDRQADAEDNANGGEHALRTL